MDICGIKFEVNLTSQSKRLAKFSQQVAETPNSNFQGKNKVIGLQAISFSPMIGWLTLEIISVLLVKKLTIFVSHPPKTPGKIPSELLCYEDIQTD